MNFASEPAKFVASLLSWGNTFDISKRAKKTIQDKLSGALGATLFAVDAHYKNSATQVVDCFRSVRIITATYRIGWKRTTHWCRLPSCDWFPRKNISSTHRTAICLMYPHVSVVYITSQPIGVSSLCTAMVLAIASTLSGGACIVRDDGGVIFGWSGFAVKRAFNAQKWAYEKLRLHTPLLVDLGVAYFHKAVFEHIQRWTSVKVRNRQGTKTSKTCVRIIRLPKNLAWNICRKRLDLAACICCPPRRKFILKSSKPRR